MASRGRETDGEMGNGHDNFMHFMGKCNLMWMFSLIKINFFSLSMCVIATNQKWNVQVLTLLPMRERLQMINEWHFVSVVFPLWKHQSESNYNRDCALLTRFPQSFKLMFVFKWMQQKNLWDEIYAD